MKFEERTHRAAKARFAIPALAAAVISNPVPAQPLLWQQAAPASAPTPRRYASFAYDPANQMCVLFGGDDIVSGWRNDTWVWDGSTWTDVSPASGPGPRFSASMAYDQSSQRVILFGGNPALPLGDTWAWDGTSWTQLTPTTPPPPRAGMALAFDEQRGVLVGFGGTTAAGITRRTYEFDGSEWTERFPPAPLPPPRGDSRAIYNAQTGRVQVFGGNSTHDDVWEWDGSTWTDVTPATVPAPRIRPVIAYDRHLDQAVMVGGWFPLYTFYDEVWLWDGQWTAHPAGARPSAREASVMAYDEARAQLVLFGGGGNGGLLDDTWLASSRAGSAQIYGNPCAAAGLILADRPVLGSTAEVRVLFPASQLAVLAVGSSDAQFQGQPLPFDLTGIGMTGCELLTSADIAAPAMVPEPSGFVAVSTQIANDPVLMGAELFLQAFVIAPGANPLQVGNTRGIAWRVGNL